MSTSQSPQALEDQTPETVASNATQNANAQPELRRLTGKEAAGSAHLKLILSDQLLSLTEAGDNVPAGHNEIDVQAAKGDHVVDPHPYTTLDPVPATRALLALSMMSSICCSAEGDMSPRTNPSGCCDCT